MCKLFKEISFSLQIEFGDELVIKSLKKNRNKANSEKCQRLEIQEVEQNV